MATAEEVEGRYRPGWAVPHPWPGHPRAPHRPRQQERSNQGTAGMSLIKLLKKRFCQGNDKKNQTTPPNPID